MKTTPKRKRWMLLVGGVFGAGSRAVVVSAFALFAGAGIAASKDKPAEHDRRRSSGTPQEGKHADRQPRRTGRTTRPSYDYSGFAATRTAAAAPYISGAHATQYTLTSADVGNTIRFRVRGEERRRHDERHVGADRSDPEGDGAAADAAAPRTAARRRQPEADRADVAADEARHRQVRVEPAGSDLGHAVRSSSACTSPRPRRAAATSRVRWSTARGRRSTSSRSRSSRPDPTGWAIAELPAAEQLPGQQQAGHPRHVPQGAEVRARTFSAASRATGSCRWTSTSTSSPPSKSDGGRPPGAAPRRH